MAKRRRRSTRSRSAFSAVPKTAKRRRSFGSIGAGFSAGNALKQGAAAGIGAIVTVGVLGMIGDKLPEAMRATPTARAMTKAAAGIGLGLAAQKLGQGKYALAIATGAVATALVDVYNDWKARQQQTNTLRGIAGIDYFGSNSAGVGELPAFDQFGNPVAFEYAGNV